MKGRMIVAAALAGVLGIGCENTDVAERGGEAAPGQELAGDELDRDVQPVDLDTVAWFTETGTLEFNGRAWIPRGEPLFDPAVEHVGEYRGTQLYAEVGVAPPYNRVLVPLENDLWQIFEASTPAGAAEAAEGGVPQGTPGVDPVGDPTETGGGTDDDAGGSGG